MAFIYILVENYWEVWPNIDLDQDMNEDAQFDEKRKKKKRRKPAWCMYAKNAFGSRRYSGWTKEGLQMFNVLHEKVKTEWLKHGETVDEKYEAHWYHPCFTKKGTTCQCQRYYCFIWFQWMNDNVSYIFSNIYWDYNWLIKYDFITFNWFCCNIFW